MEVPAKERQKSQSHFCSKFAARTFGFLLTLKRPRLSRALLTSKRLPASGKGAGLFVVLMRFDSL
jgi:hypothetical protein